MGSKSYRVVPTLQLSEEVDFIRWSNWNHFIFSVSLNKVDELMSVYVIDHKEVRGEKRKLEK